jgi:hypothetical protein
MERAGRVLWLASCCRVLLANASNPIRQQKAKTQSSQIKSGTSMYDPLLALFFFELHKYGRRRATHNKRTYTHSYEHTYANSTSMSIFERLCRHISRLMKSTQAAHTLTPMNTCTQTLPYKHIRNTVPAHLEIDEVTVRTSLSTGTSPTTETTTSLNPGINTEKYEHRYQIEDLNVGGQVPPRET